MAVRYRLLLDEHVDPKAAVRLNDRGHDVVHVDTVSGLEKGATDLELAAYSLERDRAIVTFDDDFVRSIDEGRYRAVLFFEDESVTARELTAIVDAMAEQYPVSEVRGLQKTGREWL